MPWCLGLPRAALPSAPVETADWPGHKLQAATLESMLESVLFGGSSNKLVMPPTEEQRTLFLSAAGGIVIKQLVPNRWAAIRI